MSVEKLLDVSEDMIRTTRIIKNLCESNEHCLICSSDLQIFGHAEKCPVAELRNESKTMDELVSFLRKQG